MPTKPEQPALFPENADFTQTALLTMRQTLGPIHTFPTVPRISTEDEQGQASAVYAQIKKTKRALETKFKGILAPFETGIKTLKSEFKRVIAPLEELESAYSTAILKYTTEEKAKQVAEQARLDVEHQRQVRALEAQNTPPEYVPSRPIVEGPARGFRTDAGTVTTRHIPKWRVVDEQAIPLEWPINGETVRLWVLNEVAIGTVVRAAAAGGADTGARPIPGIELYFVDTLAMRG